MTMQDSPLARKLSGYITLSENDMSVVGRFQRNKRTFAAGVGIVHEGQHTPSAFVLAEGWVSSYKMLQGGGRQIIDFQIPGDFLGLRSVLFRTSDQCIEAVTQVSTSEMVLADLLTAFETSPSLATAVLSASASEEAVIVERLVSLGRRDAAERIIHFLLELWTRLRAVGLADESCFNCPLSQYHLADALGLSAVHINRVLRQLREENILTFRRGVVTFHSFEALMNEFGFDRTYLEFNGTKQSQK